MHKDCYALAIPEKQQKKVQSLLDQFPQWEKSALRLQSIFRDHQARKVVAAMKAEKDVADRAGQSPPPP